MSNMLDPKWKYTPKGFIPLRLPPHAHPLLAPSVPGLQWCEVGRSDSFIGNRYVSN